MSSADNLCKRFGPISGIRTDRTQNVGPDIWIQTVWHSDVFLKEFFGKVNFEKKLADGMKSMEITQKSHLYRSSDTMRGA